MTEPSLTEPVSKRADQLVVGDRIPDEHLAFRFNQGPAEVVFVVHEDTLPLPWIFVAYRYPNGQHDSMTIRPEAELKVYPAPDPEITQPIGEQRLVGDGGVWAVPLAGGLVEIDPPEGFVPASAPSDCHHECATLGVSPDCGVHRHEVDPPSECPGCGGRTAHAPACGFWRIPLGGE